MIDAVSKCTKRYCCEYTIDKGFIVAVSKIIAEIVTLFLPYVSNLNK
jgi:hypothetical protein